MMTVAEGANGRSLSNYRPVEGTMAFRRRGAVAPVPQTVAEVIVALRQLGFESGYVARLFERAGITSVNPNLVQGWAAGSYDGYDRSFGRILSATYEVLLELRAAGVSAEELAHEFFMKPQTAGSRLADLVIGDAAGSLAARDSLASTMGHYRHRRAG